MKIIFRQYINITHNDFCFILLNTIFIFYCSNFTSTRNIHDIFIFLYFYYFPPFFHYKTIYKVIHRKNVPYTFYFIYNYYYFMYLFIIFLDLQYPSFTDIFILYIGSFQFQSSILKFDFSVQI